MLGLELRFCALGTSTLGAIIRLITLVSTHGAGAIFAYGVDDKHIDGRDRQPWARLHGQRRQSSLTG
jgi:hypothetical protein